MVFENLGTECVDNWTITSITDREDREDRKDRKDRKDSEDSQSKISVFEGLIKNGIGNDTNKINGGDVYSILIIRSAEIGMDKLADELADESEITNPAVSSLVIDESSFGAETRGCDCRMYRKKDYCCHIDKSTTASTTLTTSIPVSTTASTTAHL